MLKSLVARFLAFFVLIENLIYMKDKTKIIVYLRNNGTGFFFIENNLIIINGYSYRIEGLRKQLSYNYMMKCKKLIKDKEAYYIPKPFQLDYVFTNMEKKIILNDNYNPKESTKEVIPGIRKIWEFTI